MQRQIEAQERTMPSSYQVGVKAFQNKKYHQAIAQLKVFLAQYPHHALAPKAFFLLAESYFYCGNYEKAIAVLEDTLQKFPLYPTAPRGMLILAKSHIHLGHLSLADEILKKAIQLYPNSRYVNDFWYERGILAYKEQEYEKARRCLIKALKNCQDPELYMRACFVLGNTYLKLNNDVAAWNLYLEGLKNKTSSQAFLRNHPQTYFNLAQLLVIHGRLKEALKAYEEIAQLAAQTNLGKKASVKAGDLALKLKKYQKALQYYCKTISNYPESPEALISMFRMADIGVDKPNLSIPPMSCYESYRHPWDTYIKLSKQPIKELAELAHLRMAQYKLKQHNFKKAVSLLKEHLRLYPNGNLKDACQILLEDSLLSWLNELYKGHQLIAFLKIFEDNSSFISGNRKKEIISKVADVYYKFGLYQRAMEYYQNVPLNNHSIIMLAKIYFNLGYYPDVEHLLEPIFEKTYNLKLKCETAQLLADTYYRDKKYNKAISHYVYFLKTCEPKSLCPYYLSIAQSCMGIKNWDEAINYIKMLIDKKCASNTAYFLLGECYYQKENYQTALNCYQSLVDKIQDNSFRSFLYYRIAKCYEYLNDYSKATLTYNILKKNNDKFWRDLGLINADFVSWQKNNREIIDMFQ